MKILVCMKQVPDTSEVTLDPITNTLIRKGVRSIINPDDKAGIEAALSLRDEIQNSEVIVVSMGPPQAEIALMETLAMGCDEAYLISDRKFGGSDTLATSTILAAALKKIGFDLIITGRQAIDGDTAQVGPQIAEHLGIPHVSYVEEFFYSDGGDEGKAMIVMRQFEDRYHKIRVKFPCLLTAISGYKEPRYLTVSGVFDADNKEIKHFGYEELKEHLDESCIGLKGSPTKVVKSYTKEQKSQGTVLKGLTNNEAVEAIMARLKEGHII
ncbi:MAG: Electron transfer flavoprotein beta subunit [Fusobacteria bacterium]|nr:MAG: Electron transfer flavoprotein beta subunit [Fusobacteriota bacterium]KAF0229196.1 MAG: Electron transfer flavoprotein beta [Fusobacteriota bacterium]